MPNSRDSAKRDRQGKVARSRNRSVRSTVRNLVKKVEKDIELAQKEVAVQDIKKMIKALDTASRKRLFSANAVARKKSRLQKKINKMQ